MSALSYLEKLLNGVDIQWKTIGEVTLRTSNIKWREATRSYRYVDLTSVDIETKKSLRQLKLQQTMPRVGLKNSLRKMMLFSQQLDQLNNGFA